MLQFDANAHADASVDARVNGPENVAVLLATNGSYDIGHMQRKFQFEPKIKPAV